MLLTRAPLYLPLRDFAYDLHVLGIPPAFVLSQDQTLMLRIQSLAKITFEIDENFTPVLQSPSLRMNPKTSVTSLDKRDRQSLFPNNPLRIVHDPADHVSLSSLFNCQNTDGQPSQSQSRKTKPNLSPSQFSPVPSGNLGASSSAARSAAALVRWPGYRPTLPTTSTGCVTFF